jgi:methionyl aminopeptidase
MTKFNKYYPDEFKKLRNAGRISSQCLDFISDKIKPGVKTKEIDELCVNFLKKYNAVSAPLFYRGFPKSICTSVNHVVCHGIPSDKALKEGDIINVDVTSLVDGFHGDTSRTYCVGKVSIKAKNLVEITKEALERSVKILKPGIYLGDIGFEIQNFVEKNGYSVVRDFCGHGVGRNFHEEPNILHYGKKGTGPKLEEGMVFTIEPMINAGKHETKLLNDGWTAVTKDKSLSAQFEHTVGITNNGYEIFTLS